MYVTIKTGNTADVLLAIVSAIELSRFTACVATHKHGIRIDTIRLRKRKPYCGAHPGPCLVTGRRHTNSTYLEGLDWIGWNSLLNDVLDGLAVSANIWSYNRECLKGGRYYVRRGRERRTRYPFQYHWSGRAAHWTQDKDDYAACFEDFCGKPPPAFDAAYQDLDGTPGVPAYTREAEAAWLEGVAA